MIVYYVYIWTQNNFEIAHSYNSVDAALNAIRERFEIAMYTPDKEHPGCYDIKTKCGNIISIDKCELPWN